MSCDGWMGWEEAEVDGESSALTQDKWGSVRLTALVDINSDDALCLFVCVRGGVEGGRVVQMGTQQMSVLTKNGKKM